VGLNLSKVGSWPNLRVLAWDGEALYASSGYRLFRGLPLQAPVVWNRAGWFNPVWWRRGTASFKLTSRLCRDGFHALALLSSGARVAAVPGYMVTQGAHDSEFKVTHEVTRGTRPLNIAVTKGDAIFWGEYFDNPERDEVHVYGSQDRGNTWEVVYTFPRKTVRHIHNVLYDQWADCLWVLTGDYEAECKVVRASCDWKTVEVVLSGNQQARAVAMIVTEAALYFASDTPLEKNFIYRLDRDGNLNKLDPINNSALYACRAGEFLFVSTMVEPSEVNTDGQASVYGTADDGSWQKLISWSKDRWPKALFQYGNAILPAGDNATNLLAVTGLAVKRHDLQTTIWRIEADNHPRSQS